MNDFFDVVRRFLLDYLPKQRCLSENTILSYRQTLNLFVAYMRDEMGIGATELTFSRIDRDAILFWILLDRLIAHKRHCTFPPATSPPRSLMGGSLNF